jgi:phage-related minor tail protein
MFTAITITAFVCLAIGIVIGQIYGRRVEQKLVAKTLSGFAAVDQDARSLVNRCYLSLSDGIKRELDKLLKR